MARYAHPELSAQVNLSDEIRELTEDLASVRKKVDKAVQRAMKKTQRWLMTHGSREIGQALGIKQITLKRRFVIDHYTQGGISYLVLWVGLMPIAAHEMGGSPRQNRQGVRVKGRQFDGAFYKTVYGREDKVWIRTGRNRREGLTTVAKKPGQKSGGNGVFISRNVGRFPVQVVGVEISQVGLAVLERYSERVSRRFREILQQELNYVVNVERSQ